MKKTQAAFDPAKDGYEIVHFVGNAYAHISKLEVRDNLPLKLKGQVHQGVTQKVFSFNFILDKFANKESEFVRFCDGENDTVTGEMMMKELSSRDKEKVWRDKGTFFCTEPPPKANWINKGYLDLTTLLGFKFPEEGGIISVMEIEEEDVIGMPVIVELGIETAKDGKTYNKVLKISKWEGAAIISPEELLEDILVPEGEEKAAF